MKNTYRNAYVRKIVNVCLITISVLTLLICVLWCCLFTTDYIMYKNNKPTVFTNTHVETTENGRVVYEDGAFYHVVMNEKQERTLYLFNKKIK